MTIETWNIVLSAVILVLLTGGGIWLKYMVQQQLKTKDTTIEALEAVAKLKEAHIASLESNTAPAIAKAYSDMREHANLMTQEAQQLSERLAEATRKQEFEGEMLLPKIILGEVNGLQMASNILDETVWKLVVPNGKSVESKFLDGAFGPLLDQVIIASERITRGIKTRLETGSKAIRKIKE